MRQCFSPWESHIQKLVSCASSWTAVPVPLLPQNPLGPWIGYPPCSTSISYVTRGWENTDQSPKEGQCRLHQTPAELKEGSTPLPSPRPLWHATYVGEVGELEVVHGDVGRGAQAIKGRGAKGSHTATLQQGGKREGEGQESEGMAFMLADYVGALVS